MLVENFDPIKSFDLNWMKFGINKNEFIEFSDNFGNFLANLKQSKNDKSFTLKKIKEKEKKLFRDESLSNSQFRNLFSTIKTIEMKGLKNEQSKNKLFMIKPLLEYSFKRKPTKAFEEFKTIIITMLDEIYKADEESQEKYFKNFSLIVEAILAYHKAHGGN